LVHREDGREACFHASRASDRSAFRQCVTTSLSPSVDVASSERLRAHLRPRSFERRLRLQGFRFLVTTSPVRVHPITRGFQPSLRSVLRRSQPLDGFLRAPAPRLVSSSNRVQEQLRRSGASRSTRASSLVERRCPLAVGKPEPPAALRLRVQNRSASTSRLCSARRSVHVAPVISRNDGRSPPRVPRLLQALHSSARAPVYPGRFRS
jgi:hypothetical protein